MKTIRYLLIGLLMLSTSLVSAQSHFSISVTAAPTYGHNNSTQTIYLPAGIVPSAPAGSTDPVPFTFSNETQTIGYVAGVMAHYQFTPDWSVSTGFWYNRSGTNGIYPFDPGSIPSRIISQNFQVPLFLNYRSGQRRLSPFFSVGALANFRRPTLYRPDASSGISDTKVLFGTSTATYRAVLGAGISYRINPHLSLIAQPMLLWNFKPKGNFEHFVSYQINGQTQLVYTF